MPTNQEKRSFLTWFSMNQEWKDTFQNKIATMFFTSAIKNFKFVECAEYEKCFIIMPSKSSKQEFSFRFYDTVLETPYQAYQWLWQNQHRIQQDTLYVEIDVQDLWLVEKYRAVLEEAPNNPFGKEAEQLLQASVQQFKMWQLQNQIDEALDARNIPRFLELSSLLNDMRARQAIEPEGEAI